jgi:hypothetical protein
LTRDLRKWRKAILEARFTTECSAEKEEKEEEEW